MADQNSDSMCPIPFITKSVNAVLAAMLHIVQDYVPFLLILPLLCVTEKWSNFQLFVVAFGNDSQCLRWSY